jgi:outer membrane immunogenic protein
LVASDRIVLGVDCVHGFMGTRGSFTFSGGGFSRIDRIRQDIDIVTARIECEKAGFAPAFSFGCTAG